ncbi:hypothetical protein AB4Y87_23420 [Paenarthrobacter sp. RAF54_2]|uniref:hypothetical protein n=1 Tax=Paenarthrobacter sp. RAF54_2 TaxID=3233061 RepID=UPI003F984E6B
MSKTRTPQSRKLAEYPRHQPVTRTGSWNAGGSDAWGSPIGEKSRLLGTTKGVITNGTLGFGLPVVES